MILGEEHEILFKIMAYKLNVRRQNDIMSIDVLDGHPLVYFDKLANDHLKTVLRIESRKPMPTIKLNWLEDSSYKAWVKKEKEGEYSININYGTLFILIDLFMRLLSHPNVLRHIGDASKEIESDEYLDYHMTDLEPIIRQFVNLNKEVPEVHPKDKTRSDAAKFFVSICFEFILLHEVAHIIMGHLDYLENKQVTDVSFSEVIKCERITKLERHTLEWDADSFAVSYFVNWWIDHHKNKKQDERIPFLFNDPYLGFFHLSYAFYMAFRVFGFQFDPTKPYLEGSHPPIRIRQHMINCTITTLVMNRYPEIDISQVAKAEESFLACEIDYQNITGVEYTIHHEQHSKITSRESMDYFQLLSDKWCEIYPELSLLAYKNINPPEKNDFSKVKTND